MGRNKFSEWVEKMTWEHRHDKSVDGFLSDDQRVMVCRAHDWHMTPLDRKRACCGACKVMGVPCCCECVTFVPEGPTEEHIERPATENEFTDKPLHSIRTDWVCIGEE